MELRAKGKFYRDLENYNNRDLAKAVRGVLQELQNAKDISQISNLIKLKKFSLFYRIRVLDDYRIGLEIRNNKITLVCFGHRHTFYREFP